MFFISKNKYLLLGIFILLLVTLIIEFSSSYYISNATNNWQVTSKELLEDIENKASESIEAKTLKLEKVINHFVEKFSMVIKGDQNVSATTFNLISHPEFNDYQIYIFDAESKLFLWSESATQNISLESKAVYQEGEFYFSRTDLITSLVTYRIFNSFTIFIAIPIEKEYKLNSNYFVAISLTDELSDKFNTEVSIDYISSKESSKDGRFYTFPIYNNFNNTIAYITVHVPRISKFRAALKANLISWQSYFLIASVLLLGFLIRKNKDLISSRIVKFIILMIYLGLIRLIIFWFSIPSKILAPELTNPEFFESNFAYGLFQSPIDFFISSLLIIILFIQGSKYFLQYLESNEKFELGKNPTIIFLIFIIAIFILTVRGFGASMRSIVFESSLRYFKYPFVFPDLPTLLMDINILILGICTLIFLMFLIIISFQLGSRFNVNKWSFIIASFTIVQIIALIFDLVQLQPQGNSALRITFITIVFIFSIYLYNFRSLSTTFVISLLFASSTITISYLIYFNSDFEVKSLRTTAFDLLKPNVEEIDSLIKSAVSDEATLNRLITEFQDSAAVNFNASAFRIWSNSKFDDERVSSQVNIISKEKRLKGSFNYNLEEDFLWDWSAVSDTIKNLTSISSQLDNAGNKILRSIMPVAANQNLYGYLEISVLLDYYSLDFDDELDIIGSSRVIEKSPVNTKHLKIFDFQNGVLTNYYTDLILSQAETELILKTELNEKNESWISMRLNGLDHIIYLKKFSDPIKDRFIAVALEKSELSWSLFNFFKIFLIHCLFILAGILTYYFTHIRKIASLSFTFRTQLLFAFIVISTVPLVLLALYFKNLTEEKNTSAIYYKLGKRADRIEQFINDYNTVGGIFPEDLLRRASNDTGIEYNLYENNNLIFSTKQVFYDVGLMPVIINADVYQNLVLTGRTDYVVTEAVEKKEFHSFYHKVNFSGQDYLIGVNDLFNRIQLPMSAAEVDIFLLGSYSLAIILVVVFSTILANQISSPIRRLTSATNAVANGDLSISIEENKKGEVGELVDGFNKMVMELQKNQNELAEMEREAAWKEMAKQVAHEIKNPLTPMKLAVQQLIAAKEDKSVKYDEIFTKVTNTVIKQIDILKNIATEFSDFAKMPDLKLTNVNLIEIINNVAALFSEENIEIKINTTSNREMINTDTEQLQRTLVNLVRNSLQAGAGKLVFDVSSNDDQITLKVIDNGNGIPDAIITRVFEANFTTKVEGMGLGLNMAKRFFDSTNTSIFIESSDKNGTIIVIKFSSIPQ